MSSAELIVNVVATAFLAALAFIPIVNLVVGAFVGAGIAGPLGVSVGILTAMLITAIEVGVLRITERRPLSEPQPSDLAHAADSMYRAIVNLADWRQAKEATAGNKPRSRYAFSRRTPRRVAA